MQWRKLFGDRAVREQPLLHPAFPVRGALQDAACRAGLGASLAATRGGPGGGYDATPSQGRAGRTLVRGVAGGQVATCKETKVPSVGQAARNVARTTRNRATDHGPIDRSINL